jgi:hypothetical protein
MSSKWPMREGNVHRDLRRLQISQIYPSTFNEMER